MTEPSELTPEQLHNRAKEIYEQKMEIKKEQGPEISEEERKIREEIAEMLKTPPPAHIQDEVSEEVQKLLTLDDQAQIAELIKLVFTKDIIFALKVLRGMQNPAVVDAFHDLLAQDQLYYKLLKQNKL